jgi:hypothetical protein
MNFEVSSFSDEPTYLRKLGVVEAGIQLKAELVCSIEMCPLSACVVKMNFVTAIYQTVT